jgi:hypothetical protein
MACLAPVIDDALLRRARQAVLKQNRSVNALVRNFPGRKLKARSRRLEAFEQFEAVARGSRNSSREALHERA